MNAGGYVAAVAAAFAAGGINAIAGGGTLITFPVLTAIGVPAVRANMTNTVALCPGYLGGALAQRNDLVGQEHRVRRFAVSGALGGLVGAVLLTVTSEALFKNIVPYLILAACALLGFQDRLKRWLGRHGHHGGDSASTPLAVFAVSIYGGYFGAGIGIMMIAAFSLLISDNTTRINALKNWMSLTINVVAAVFFVSRSLVSPNGNRVWWALVPGMAVAALAGGAAGGKLAGRLQPVLLRRLVITFGVVVALIYLVR